MDFLFSLISLGFAFTVFLTVLAVFIAFIVLRCIGRMRMFAKAGEVGWAAWIPFYSDYVMCRATMGKGYYFLFGYIPVIGWVANIVYSVEISLSYGQGYVFAVLYYFFAPVCDMILGFGGSVYMGAQDVEAQARRLFSAGKKED